MKTDEHFLTIKEEAIYNIANKLLTNLEAVIDCGASTINAIQTEHYVRALNILMNIRVELKKD